MSSRKLKRGVYLEEQMIVLGRNLLHKRVNPQKSLGILRNQDGNADENINQMDGGCD